MEKPEIINRIKRISLVATVHPLTDSGGNILTMEQKLQNADDKFQLIDAICEEILKNEEK